MNSRILGRTGIEVGMIGLGTEYLNGVAEETVVSVVQEAIDNGVNYIDLLFAFPEYRNNFGMALKGRRDKAVLAGHLGSGITDGQYKKTTNKKECEFYFHDLLTRLCTDYVDILMIHNVNSPRLKELEPGGLLDIALKYKKEGKTRFIGLSSHLTGTALKAVKSGKIDVLMFPVNMEKDAFEDKKELFSACNENNVGLVAMKPFAGGKLLQNGGHEGEVTPVKCISYVLSKLGVSTVVPGVKDLDELRGILKFNTASNEEKDFSSILKKYQKNDKGECVYCNHCLPCPQGIDVGTSMRLLDMSKFSLKEDIENSYEKVISKTLECTFCGTCRQRCPFEIDTNEKLHEFVSAFGLKK